MYYHGLLENGHQLSRVAISSDGLHFSARDDLIGLPYFRVFRLGEMFYALAMPGFFFRSQDGRSNFERGPWQEDGRVWLLYAGAGENGIGMARLGPGSDSDRVRAIR
jgi:hypothetical protein